MPRFFFDVQDGHSSRDDEGVELPDVQAARLQAAEMAGRLLSDTAQRFWDHGELTVVVRGEEGLVLFAVAMTGVDAPVAAPMIPGRS